MPDHISSGFDSDLQELKTRVTQLGGYAEKLTVDAVSALVGRDAAKARMVISADAELDRLQRQIEEHAIGTLLRRGPMAIDLREVIAANRMAGDLERIGDLAKNIAKRVLAIGEELPPSRLTAGLERMNELALAQLKEVLDAYVAHDVSKSVDVWHRDGAIDELHTSMFRALMAYMTENPLSISFCTHLLFCAKNIERIGDHTTNIAETIHYLVTGTMISGERPKNDRSTLPLPRAGTSSQG